MKSYRGFEGNIFKDDKLYTQRLYNQWFEPLLPGGKKNKKKKIQWAVSTIYIINTSEGLKRMCKLSEHLFLLELVVVNNMMEEVI